MKRYICILFAALLLCVTLQAQEVEKEQKKKKPSPMAKTYSGQPFHGVSVLVDVATPITSLFSSYKAFAAEAYFNVNLYNQLYPTVEAGFGTVEKQYDNSGIKYHASAPYFRIGIDYSLMGPYNRDGKARDSKNYPFIGLRYGMSFMNYGIDNIIISDPYWNENHTNSYTNKLTYCGWLELVGGLRVNIAKGFTMGWSVRLKTALHTSAPSKDYTWYVPGFGRSDGMNFSFNYTIGYTFLK